MQQKRIFTFVLLLAMTLSVFSGCDKEEQTSAGTVSDFESQTHIQVSAPAAESTSGETTSGETSDSTSKEPLSGEFVVSEKKYDYKDANLELLYVENQTNRHCNVTIHGKYLDENGETIQEETQTFEAFPSGWSNNFIFYPKIAFDSFTYELETEEYVADPIFSDADGNPFASYIELTYEKKLYWKRGIAGGDESRWLVFDTELKNNHPTVTISAEFHVLVLDTDGNIFITDYDFDSNPIVISGTNVGPVGSEDDGKFLTNIFLLQQEPGLDETIPENVQGVFTAVFAFKDVIDYQEFVEQTFPDGIPTVE